MPYPSEFPDAPLVDRPFSDVLLDAMWKHSVNNPHRLAFISAEDETIRLTYRDLYTKTLSIAAFLEKFQFGHGDIACLVTQNCWEYFAIFLAAALQGGAISGASVLFTDFELERQFRDSNCKVVFCADKSIDRVLKAAKQCRNIKVIVEIPTQKYTKTDYPFGIYAF
jgi:4-coumarate--CoA ligase